LLSVTAVGVHTKKVETGQEKRKGASTANEKYLSQESVYNLSRPNQR
jgi:hypothetical protein